MAEVIKNARLGTPMWVKLILIISIVLDVAGFLVPPMGQIDGSVLWAGGILFGGYALCDLVHNLPLYIKNGAKISMSANLPGGAGIGVDIEQDEEDE